MSLIAIPNVFIPHTAAQAAQVNANFGEVAAKFNASAVLTDVARTINVLHTFSAGLTVAAGATALQALTAAATTITGSGTSLTVSGGSGVGTEALRVAGAVFVIGGITAGAGLTAQTGGLTVTAGTTAVQALTATTGTFASGLTVTTGGLTVSAGTTAVQALTAAAGATITGTATVTGAVLKATGTTGTIANTFGFSIVLTSAVVTGTYLVTCYKVGVPASRVCGLWVVLSATTSSEVMILATAGGLTLATVNGDLEGANSTGSSGTFTWSYVRLS